MAPDYTLTDLYLFVSDYKWLLLEEYAVVRTRPAVMAGLRMKTGLNGDVYCLV